MGTYNYMAPERFTGDEVTYRADIYALACVLGECLTGAPPYPRRQRRAVDRRASARAGAAAQPAAARDAFRRPLDQVIGKGMAKNPADRYSQRR